MKRKTFTRSVAALSNQDSTHAHQSSDGGSAVPATTHIRYSEIAAAAPATQQEQTLYSLNEAG